MKYRISARPRESYKGFWRAGIFFPNAPAYIEMENPPEAILREPMLIIEPIADKPAKKGKVADHDVPANDSGSKKQAG